jgi:molecular chaperone GrpE (heat shock protein)
MDETSEEVTPEPVVETPAPADPRLDQLLEKVQDLEKLLAGAGAPAPQDPRVDKAIEKLSLLEQLFVKRIKDDQVHAAAYNSLYQEMARYRDNALLGMLKPLFRKLVLLYDTMKRSLETLEDPSGREAVTLHVEELQEVLRQHDVALIEERPEVFDAKIQKAISTEPAEGPEEHQKVVRVVRDGFRWGANVLRPQEVVIKVQK